MLQPEGLTVEQSWLLDLYTFFHARNYRAYRVVLPDEEADDAIAHLLLPPGPGPHPAIVVYPILEGSHVVSEGLAKALVRRGFAVARLERRELDLAEARDVETPARVFRRSILDGRRLIDWLVSYPEIDAERIAVAGVSTGAILSLTLLEVEPRARAGFFLMVGGNLPALLYDSSERPVRIFRERLRTRYDLGTREAWIEFVRPHLEPVDPLTYAHRIQPDQVLLITGRFDRVVRPRYTRQLWETLGRPVWRRFPTGHYQFLPFFWWAAARGADHLERYFARRALGPQAPLPDGG